MAWIIGIMVVVIAVIFWREALPIGILAVIVIGSMALYEHYDNEKKAHEKEIAAAALKQKISKAMENASPEGKEWHVYYEQDPAIAKNVARYASIVSNGGLCRLVVRKRSDGSDQTGLYCPDFKMYEYKDMQIKFDNATTPDKIDIGKFNDKSGIYVSPFLFVSPGHIDYKDFMNRLKAGKTLAINVSAEDGIWVKFNLDGGVEAINMLGKEQVR